jgi:hypothetical protein
MRSVETSPSLPKLGTRPDKLLTCLTSLSRDTLVIFLRISTGNGPPGSTTVTSQGQMTSKKYATSSCSKVNVVQDMGLIYKTNLRLSLESENSFVPTLSRVLCNKCVKWTHNGTDVSHVLSPKFLNGFKWNTNFKKLHQKLLGETDFSAYVSTIIT